MVVKLEKGNQLYLIGTNIFGRVEELLDRDGIRK